MKRTSQILAFAGIIVAATTITQGAQAAPRVGHVVVDAAGGTLRIQGATKPNKALIDCGYAGGTK